MEKARIGMTDSCRVSLDGHRDRRRALYITEHPAAPSRPPRALCTWLWPRGATRPLSAAAARARVGPLERSEQGKAAGRNERSRAWTRAARPGLLGLYRRTECRAYNWNMSKVTNMRCIDPYREVLSENRDLSLPSRKRYRSLLATSCRIAILLLRPHAAAYGSQAQRAAART